MRQILAILVFYFQLAASAYSCPSYLATNREAQDVHQWLSRFTQIKKLHGCRLDIRVCDPEEEFKDDAPVGEVLVITPNGREAYVSVDFPIGFDWRFQTHLETYTRAFYYRKKDRHYEEVEGRTEVWQLEFRTLWDDSTVLDDLDLGIYSTKSQLNQNNGNDSHWYNCTKGE